MDKLEFNNNNNNNNNTVMKSRRPGVPIKPRHLLTQKSREKLLPATKSVNSNSSTAPLSTNAVSSNLSKPSASVSTFSTPSAWRPAPKLHQRVSLKKRDNSRPAINNTPPVPKENVPSKSKSSTQVKKSQSKKMDGDTRQFKDLKSLWESKNDDTGSISSNSSSYTGHATHAVSGSGDRSHTSSFSSKSENENEDNGIKRIVQSGSYKKKTDTWHYLKATSPPPQTNNDNEVFGVEKERKFSRISSKKFTYNHLQSPRPFSKSFSISIDQDDSVGKIQTSSHLQQLTSAHVDVYNDSDDIAPVVNKMPLPPKDYIGNIQPANDLLPKDEYVDIWNRQTPPIVKEKSFDFEGELDDVLDNADVVVAPPVPVRDDKRGRAPSLHNYTPMAGVPSPPLDVYDMAFNPTVKEPQLKPGSDPREYFEIDPDSDVPITSTIIEEDPPPLPLPNKQGKRSVVNKNGKLNYIEIELGGKDSPNKSSPHENRTSYTDVTTTPGGGIRLETNKKSKGKSTKKFSKLFGSKENISESGTKSAGEEDSLTDFGEERNKKKRRSFGLTRKKMDKSKTRDEIRRRSAENNIKIQSAAVKETAPHTVSSPTDATPPLARNGHLMNSPSVDSPAKQTSIEHPSSDDTDMKQQSSFHKQAIRRHTDASEGFDAPRIQSHLHGAKSRSHTTDPTMTTRIGIPAPPTSPPPIPKSLAPNNSGQMSPTFPITNGDDAVSPSLPTAPPPLPPSAPQISRDTKPDRFRSSSKADQTIYLAAEDVPPAPKDVVSLEPVYDDVCDSVPEIDKLPVPGVGGIKRFSKYQRSKFIESEPLYQEYRSRTLSHASSKVVRPERVKKQTSVPEGRRKSGEGWKSELMSEEAGTSTLWRNIPEVKSAGIADGLTPDKIKMQQAQFEVVTSQASYLRSLEILINHFMGDWAMKSTDYLPRNKRKDLFSNVEAVYEVEVRLLQDLEEHFWEKLMLTEVCNIVMKFMDDFTVYVRYIQNNAFQERVLTQLQQTNDKFAGELCRLESSSACNKLPLGSFLLLPMQRVTRLPLLISAIVSHADNCKDIVLYDSAKKCLTKLNKLVKDCNESARRMQQTEQLAEIASSIEYASSVKTFALVSQQRSLIKKGEMLVVMDTKKKSQRQKLHLFLFTDVLLFARKKSFITAETKFEVIEWAKRAMVYVNERAMSDNAIFMVLLENSVGKRVEVSIMPSSQNEISRWTDALSPQKGEEGQESIYETWDSPQYSCIKPYKAQQPDELSIDVDEIFKVVKKTSDGWLEGERLRDNEVGWFPAEHCQEIYDEHVRARNLRNLYIAPAPPQEPQE